MAIKLIFPQTRPRSSGSVAPLQKRIPPSPPAAHPRSMTADFKELLQRLIIRQLAFFSFFFFF